MTSRCLGDKLCINPASGYATAVLVKETQMRNYTHSLLRSFRRRLYENSRNRSVTSAFNSLLYRDHFSVHNHSQGESKVNST